MDNGNIINWCDEGAAVMQDIGKHVKEIKFSKKLNEEYGEWGCFLNVTTFEDLKYCIKLSSDGFQIVGNQYDSNSVGNADVADTIIYETPYALLSSISKCYVSSFGLELQKSLLQLQNDDNKD